jgi:hypothetical protein
MAKEAATKALADAKIGMAEVKQAVVGYVYGELVVFNDCCLAYIN